MKKPIALKILKKLAPQIGAKLLIEPDYGFVGQIIFKNGQKTFFRNTNFNLNRLGSIEIARDKAYAKFFLKKFGYTVAPGQTFFSQALNEKLALNKRRTIDNGLVYAQKLGFPVILKPNNLSQGCLVGKIYNQTDYYTLANKILNKTPVMLIEKFQTGHDYRIVVLDQEIISVYERIPLLVIGDGQKQILELLEDKQAAFIGSGRDTIIKLDDFRLKINLKQKGLTLNSVLAKDERIFLLDNANLSTGGEAIDLTDQLHADYKKLAKKIAKDMDLRLCGVDLITTDEITVPLAEYIILEVNGAPGLDNYAALGKKQERTVEALYLKVLQALEKN